MRTRFRTLAALLALLAFSASFAEQVWASTCARAVAVATQHTAAEPQADGGHGHTGHTPAAPVEHRAPDGGDGCPPQAVAAGCALLLFPAPVRQAATPAADPRVVISPDAGSSPERLFVSFFFRPPQR